MPFKIICFNVSLGKSISKIKQQLNNKNTKKSLYSLWCRIIQFNIFDRGQKHLLQIDFLLNSILNVFFFLCLTDFLILFGKIRRKKTFSCFDGVESRRGVIQSVTQSNLLKFSTCEVHRRFTQQVERDVGWVENSQEGEHS